MFRDVLRSLVPISFDPKTDIPVTVLANQLWVYALTVLYPAQALKSLGVYPSNEIGRCPAPLPFRGEGQFYCRRYPKPSYFDHQWFDTNPVDYFDRVSTIYDTYVQPATRPIYEETVNVIQPFLVPTARILDTSCGPGTEMLQLARLAPEGEVVGMDLSAGMLEAAFENAQRQEILNTAFFQADVAHMPEHFEGRFDMVFCSGAFHHYPDPVGALKEMHRVLNDTGKACISDPGPWWFNLLWTPIFQWADPGWVSFYTGEEFCALFHAAGFSDFYWTEVLPGIGVCVGSK